MHREYSRSLLLILIPRVLVLLSVFSPGVVATSFSNEIADSIKGNWGQFKLNANWRYANVDQEGKAVAKGDPVRLRFGYLSPKIFEFQGFAEFEGNTPVFEYQHDSTRNGKTEFPVVADPQAAELNQGWLSYAGLSDSLITGGRQEINYDNQRFLGTVPWRQLEQTFDSVTVVNKTIVNSEIKIAYIWNVKTVESKDIGMSSPMLNLSHTIPELGKLTAYAYLLDYSDTSANSTQSYGVRFTGKTGVRENLKAIYSAEYSYQRDYQTNPNRYNTNYMHFIGGFEMPEIAWDFANLSGKVGWEQLGSDNNVGFKTPLGTNHAFNGWADKFLTTPSLGIRDFYGILSTRIHGFKLMAIYHQYDSATGNIDYGHEIDALVVKKFSGHYTILLKYADYFASGYATDTRKIWVSVGVDF